MLRKRTTAPDGIAAGPGPPHLPRRRVIHAALELARHAAELTDRPSLAQLRCLARFGGVAPRSYRLDPALNWLPESLPVGFPLGATGLRFAHVGGTLVALPDGSAFALG